MMMLFSALEISPQQYITLGHAVLYVHVPMGCVVHEEEQLKEWIVHVTDS